MARPRANLRMFVAAYPPLAVAERLLELAADLALPAHRLVPAAQVHLTLQFIGDRPAREIERTAESVRRAASGLGAFVLVPQRLRTIPDRGPPRLLAAETDAPAALLELERRLVNRLARTRSGRPYRPHLTLLRFARGAETAPPIDEAIPGAAGLGFAVERVHLMRSTLRAEGAEHHEVAAADLPARG